MPIVLQFLLLCEQAVKTVFVHIGNKMSLRTSKQFKDIRDIRVYNYYFTTISKGMRAWMRSAFFTLRMREYTA